MKTLFARFLNDESGATAIEYALVAGLIALGIVAGAGALGDGISNSLNDVNTALGNNIPTG
ncbi:MAG: Flp family type IVb pilin [Maricaulaceae bacterium]